MKERPYLYRVDFYLGGRIIGHTLTRAWSRREAWINSWSTKAYLVADAEAKRETTSLMWDATRLERQEEV